MNFKKMILGFLAMGLAFAIHGSKYDLHGIWPVIGQNQENTGVALYSEIDNTNVSELTQDWVFSNLTQTGVSATPTISNGMVFIANATGNVYALNQRTGSVVWQQTLVASDRGNVPQAFDTSPTITKNRVFVAGDHMFALDKSTGAVLWDTPIYQPGNYLTDSPGNPMVAGTNVIIGVGFNNEDTIPPSGHYTGEYGRIMAFDQDTGNITWQFALSNTNFGTGGTSFSMAGVDNVRKLVFIGTGNNYEPPSSPYADSLLALNYETGELAWSFQFTNGDVWSGVYYTHDGMHDFDVGAHPNLFQVKINGQKHDLVGVGGKDGTYRIFERDQDPSNVTPLIQIQLDPGGLLGGILVTPVVANGTIYLSSNAAVDSGGNRLTIDTFFTDGLANFATDSFIALTEATSKIVAIDLKKLMASGAGFGTAPVPPPANTILWTYIQQGVVLSPSALSYVNGVLFYTDVLGTINALDAHNGTLQFSSVVFPLGSNVNAFVSGGASIAGERIFVPFGIENGTPYGGVVAYKLPG